MDLRLLGIVFGTMFLAELGDKTQLAILLYAADKESSKLTVFVGAVLALMLTSAIGVAAGGLISRFVSERFLSIVAGLGFIAVGVWTLIRS